MAGSVLNIVIKLIAVLLAIFLWFNVITQKQYEHDLNLKVTDVELPPSLGAVTAFPDSLTVRVLAEGKKLLSNDWKNAGLRIKCNRLRRGINNLELNLETVALVRSEDVNLVDLLGVAPISVQLDNLDSILKPVASRLAVIPREDYMIIAGQGGVSPLQTQVIGPGLLLKRIDSIFTEQKILDDIKGSVQLSLALQIPDNMDISLGHDSATVEVAVDKIKQKRFENIPIAVGIGWGGRIIVDPDHVTIDIEGPESSLDSLGEKHIKISVPPHPGVTDGYVTPLITLPPNFSAAVVTPDSIRILVSP